MNIRSGNGVELFVRGVQYRPLHLLYVHSWPEVLVTVLKSILGDVDGPVDGGVPLVVIGVPIGVGPLGGSDFVGPDGIVDPSIRIVGSGLLIIVVPGRIPEYWLLGSPCCFAIVLYQSKFQFHLDQGLGIEIFAYRLI